MANTTALAAARHHVLAAVGWDVETDGLAGSPHIRLVVDANGAMEPTDLERVLSLDPDRPTLICCQAGNVNTGAVIARVQEEGTCWLGGSMWRNQAVMRISVSNLATTDADVTASVVAIIAADRYTLSPT